MVGPAKINLAVVVAVAERMVNMGCSCRLSTLRRLQTVQHPRQSRSQRSRQQGTKGSRRDRHPRILPWSPPPQGAPRRTGSGVASERHPIQVARPWGIRRSTIMKNPGQHPLSRGSIGRSFAGTHLFGLGCRGSGTGSDGSFQRASIRTRVPRDEGVSLIRGGHPG